MKSTKVFDRWDWGKMSDNLKALKATLEDASAPTYVRLCTYPALRTYLAAATSVRGLLQPAQCPPCRLLQRPADSSSDCNSDS